MNIIELLHFLPLTSRAHLPNCNYLDFYEDAELYLERIIQSFNQCLYNSVFNSYIAAVTRSIVNTKNPVGLVVIVVPYTEHLLSLW